ncbi:alpha amylase, catalytic subdomain [Thiobacillus denitrificans ATCC 25259]|uniref:maltose alpha-D-glucosyltransferase n=1 Tax=Thiobacillus denitrificans (strain ATCC 25259 / T1) TaxID=292415 RepID=Q3SJM9_THIDA|nr:maltose alpha-D-glucosyltransferase [Thiobacillus denitrificans]AAZ97125.1 alpha amylase, catalytic subdomain [Thiobacillus denitrificans ATCC 25259]
MEENDPLWYKDAIVYELHVKAFFDANGDGAGDFRGLISKLDYLQELGVNALWLLPFYPSPGRDDGYDISDYHNLHPSFGDMADFRRFIREAHQRGLRVITELVVNHTSDQHPWFQAARRAPPGSVKRNYYVWSDTDTRFSETRIIFSDTEKSNWAWDEVAQAYYWHRFFSHQPDLNFNNPHVFKAIMRTMRFWFDAGVDGMRLDAVPYLCERDGTSNENLPETHAVIRRMRAELDARYSNRMFLAEANQWPEDVREYFGNGDECHMAYHFPLMPRMYMAIAQEDRHPIVEIMEQTPDIPDLCQWAVFLRNHDELTLEMVTDRERDYLYQAYASDPQARLNLGIRRRLAPLLDNDRHRIELMNLLLMTMPGSPIVYYGDEIGMGDNLLLGDRNGVRTPMQWDGGPNGGFSSAPTERLFLPPITDPVYGYGAVNVEAQQRNPSSLLNWTRRLIAMRKAHRALGRGTLRFLRPGNRKVLAYLREYEGETILCVANVARAPQAVELDLSPFKGHVPVELMGRSSFPPIGELPYLLTLGGYGCFVFRLATDVEAPAWHEERPVPPDLPVLVLVDAGWRTLFARTDEGVNQLMVRRAREQLERQIIPRYFRTQPWFVYSEAALEKFEFGTLREWGTDSGTWLLATVTVTLLDGSIYHYALPLGLAWEDEDEGRVAALLHVTLAKVRRLARVGILFDAFWDDGFCCAIVSAMERGETLAYGDGHLTFRTASAYPGFFCPLVTSSITRTVSEHGRLRVNLNDQLVLKSYPRQMQGTHPELEMSRFLTETAKFAHIPQLGGTVEYVASSGRHSTLAILERYAPNQGDAWAYTLNYLERFLDLSRTTGEQAPDGRHGRYMGLMKTLGERTAEFHRALATPDRSGDFGSEPIAPPDILEWVNKVRHEMGVMYELLERALPALPEPVAVAAQQLFLVRPKLYRRVIRASRVRVDASKTRCHGNYHLGQVWLVQNDFLIANYGGIPGRSWEERRAKHAPLRDVASMLLSLSQAGAAALARVAGDSVDVMAALQPHVDAWELAARKAFYRGYRKGMDGHAAYPTDATAAEALLTLFLAEKAIAELTEALERRAVGSAAAMRRLVQVTRR